MLQLGLSEGTPARHVLVDTIQGHRKWIPHKAGCALERLTFYANTETAGNHKEGLLTCTEHSINVASMALYCFMIFTMDNQFQHVAGTRYYKLVMS